MLLRSRSLLLGLSLLTGTLMTSTPNCLISEGRAQDAVVNKTDEGKAAEGKVVELADGKLVLRAPAEWKSVEPRSRIVQYEFAAPANAPADSQARVTVMGAGGSVEDNIKRWYAQFEQPDGSPTKEKSKAEKIQVAGQTIHLVDIPGTFKDSGGGPFFQQRPAVMRENYRMLGAIIETKDMGLHFFKVTGPAATVDKLKDGFHKMLQGLEVKK